jgi:hypothetical protein
VDEEQVLFNFSERTIVSQEIELVSLGISIELL